LESVSVPFSPEWGIVESRSSRHSCVGYRFYPHKLQGEGFFLTVFRKPGTGGKEWGKKTQKAAKQKNHVEPKALERWIVDPQRYYNFMVGDQLHVIDERLKEDFIALRNMLYLKNAGLRIGKIHKTEILIPDHALALSTICNPDLPKMELDYENALDYLRKNSLSVEFPPSQPMGWTLMAYQGAVMGWAKTMPGRINNYYPKDCRIVNL